MRDTDYDEHNISIRSYTQLVGLYNVLEDMKKHCQLNTASGCHIHVDLRDLIGNSSHINKRLYTLKTFFTAKIQSGEIDKLFGEYEGGMMRSKKCDDDNKSAWITTRNILNSLEFRTPPMTFDYSTIVKWFIGVNKLLNECEHIIRQSEKIRDKPPESPNVRTIQDRYCTTDRYGNLF